MLFKCYQQSIENEKQMSKKSLMSFSIETLDVSLWVVAILPKRIFPTPLSPPKKGAVKKKRELNSV